MQQRLDLIVGLGNPDPEYLLTRHNAGFWLVDALARSQGARFTRDKKLLGETSEVEIAGTRVRLLKPQTYMNLSGQSVAAALAYYKIPPERLLVAYDEIDLPAGSVRLKLGGGHAGHNGVRNVIEHIGAEFWRIRLGVGHPGRGRKEKVIGHVLNRATAEEEKLILEGIAEALDILPVLIEQGGQRAQNRLHGPKPGTPGAGEAKEP